MQAIEVGSYWNLSIMQAIEVRAIEAVDKLLYQTD
jgi:hypothetical protein